MNSTDSVRPNRGNSERDPHLHSHCHVAMNADWSLTNERPNPQTSITEQSDVTIADLVEKDERLRAAHHQAVKHAIQRIEMSSRKRQPKQ